MGKFRLYQFCGGLCHQYIMFMTTAMVALGGAMFVLYAKAYPQWAGAIGLASLMLSVGMTVLFQYLMEKLSFCYKEELKAYYKMTETQWRSFSWQLGYRDPELVQAVKQSFKWAKSEATDEECEQVHQLLKDMSVIKVEAVPIYALSNQLIH